MDTKIFVIETKKEYGNEPQMMQELMMLCYTEKASGKVFRGKTFCAMYADGITAKITFWFDKQRLAEIKTATYKRQFPNYVFPFMLDGDGKRFFFRDKPELMQFLADNNGKNYTLTTTTETLLNNKGVLSHYTVNFDTAANVLIVDGVNYNVKK